MGDFIKKIFKTFKKMKLTKRALIWIWIGSIFFSPLIGLFSILLLSYIEIVNQIDWKAGFSLR